MTGYWLVNTNERHRPDTKAHMLANRCVCAQYDPKVDIDRISAGDVVFIYENVVGIIGYGIADGRIIIRDYKGERNEQHEMRLDQFEVLPQPITPSQISAISWNLDRAGVFYARTVVPLRDLAGAELYRIAKELIRSGD
ncbi:hypothetical protein JXA88_01565 [Candidatus Fermentibacteria bacterium]|nr:hypothetical protein [Candidatus Fermentibacteria bacterium]